MSGISYARTPVVYRPTSEDDRPPWSSSIPLEVALAAPIAPKSASVLALVNHGRWVVSCPDCSSAQLACPTDRRFMCHECANIAIGVKWRPVVWPDNPAALSDALAGRTDRTLQNLEPGETVEQLLEQNELLAAGWTEIRYVPGADTEEEVAGAASDHEGHTHQWPKTVKADKVYSCPGCGAENTGLTIEMGRGVS